MLPLYKQQHTGLYDKPFDMQKFRAMANANNEHGNLLKDSSVILGFKKNKWGWIK